MTDAREDDPMSAPIDDAVLGHLNFDKEANWWTGQVELEPGQRVGLTLEADPNVPDAVLMVKQGRAWVERVREREDEYTRWTAEHLLDARRNKDRPMTLDDIFDL